GLARDPPHGALDAVAALAEPFDDLPELLAVVLDVLDQLADRLRVERLGDVLAQPLGRLQPGVGAGQVVAKVGAEELGRTHARAVIPSPRARRPPRCRRPPN